MGPSITPHCVHLGLPCVYFHTGNSFVPSLNEGKFRAPSLAPLTFSIKYNIPNSLSLSGIIESPPKSECSSGTEKFKEGKDGVLSNGVQKICPRSMD
jgi:hypothetical protein